MNVLYLLTTVIRTQLAPTLLDLSCVLVTVDILEMELYAKVNKFCLRAVNNLHRYESMR